MELRHLRYFVAVAEELHFGRAAGRLHVAQPALSVQIRSLEQQLGGQLLRRTQRHVSLTDAGERFLPEARATLAQADRAAKLARQALRGELGTVSIGVTGSIAYTGLLGRALQGYQEQVPGVELQLEEIDPMSQIARLQSHRLDVGLLSTLSMQIPEGLSTIALASWPLRVAVAVSHPLAGRQRLSVEAFRDEPFIQYSVTNETETSSAIRDVLGYEPKIAHRGTNLLMVLALVRASLGVALVPSAVASLAEQSGVRLIPFGKADLQLDCAAAFRTDFTEPAVRSFLDHLRARFAEPGDNWQ